MSSVEETFDNYIADLNHLKTAFVAFNHKLFLDFCDILAFCHFNHLEHYITEMFKKVYYILQLAEKMRESTLFNTIKNDQVEKLQMDESVPLIMEVIHEMRRKFTQLGKIMYKRSDVSYPKCEFDIQIPRILVTLKKKPYNYFVAMDTNKMGSTFRFRADPAMRDQIENMVIASPASTSDDYSHEGWLTTRASQQNEEETFNSNKEAVCKMMDIDLSDITYRKSAAEQEYENHADGIRQFNNANGLGSRKSFSGSKKTRGYEPPGVTSHPSSTHQTPTIIADSATCSITFSSSTSSSPDDSFNTTIDSGFSDDTILSPTYTNVNSPDSLLDSSDSVTPIRLNNDDDTVNVMTTKQHLFLAGRTDIPQEIENQTTSESMYDAESVEPTNKERPPYNFQTESLNKQPMYVSKLLSLDETSDTGDEPPLLTHQEQLRNRRRTERRHEKTKKSNNFLGHNSISSSDDDEESFIGEGKLDPRSVDDDFFCNDGDHEEIYPLSEFRKEVLTNKLCKNNQKTQNSISLNNVDADDEEFSSGSDIEAKKFKTVRFDFETSTEQNKINKNKKERNLLKSQHKGSFNKSVYSATKAKVVAATKIAATSLLLGNNPQNLENLLPTTAGMAETATTFSQALKAATLKKRTREEFKEDPVEDASLFLQNTTRMLLVSEDSNSNAPNRLSSDVHLSTTELQKMNSNLDRNLVLFLVKHCTTRIGAEIGLERCIMDYIFKKQNVNRLSKLQQQYISNWQEIFLNIEKLVAGSIKDDRNNDHDALERAHQRTKNLLYQNFMVKRSLLEQNTSLNEEEQELQIDALKAKHSTSSAKLAAIANKAKNFNEQSYRYSLRKVNSTLHSVCMKVCMMWLQQNNAMHLLEPAMLESYSKRMLVDCNTINQISNVTKNGFFVMDASDMLEVADGVLTLPSSEELSSEQEQLQNILGDDHVNKLMKTIESISDDQDSVLKLVHIVWGKEPRVKLAYSIHKPRKLKESENVPVAAMVSLGGPDNDQKLTESSASAALLSPPLTTAESLASAAVGTKKITTFYGANSNTSVNCSTPSSDNTNSAVSVDFDSTLIIHSPVSDTNGSLFKIALSFDKILATSTNTVCASSDLQALSLTIKQCHTKTLLNRLRFLRFLLENKSREPALVLQSFANSEWYDIFQCVFLLKCDNVNACNTASDGYCMTRAAHQLKCRQDSDFQLDIKGMRAIDEQCNPKERMSSVNNDDNVLLSFVRDLPCLLKDESTNQTLIAVIGELKWFTFKAKLHMMEALLALRAPGHQLEQKFWGDAQIITMLGFNITSVSALVGDDFIDWIGIARGKWVKYEASSVPRTRSMESWKCSNTTLSDLDQVVEENLNLMLYRKPHFSVCSHAASRSEVIKEFGSLKLQCLEKILERIAVSEEMTPDILLQLNNIITKCEMKSQNVDYDYFDCVQFATTLHRRWPESAKKEPLHSFDFSTEEDGGLDMLHDKHTYELKRALDTSQGKLQILEEYNAVLFDAIRSHASSAKME